MLKRNWVGLGALAVGAWACNPHPVTPFETSIISEQSDSFGAVGDLKVDVLWVIDNSGSMCDEQQSLRENFDLFVEALIFHGLDFNLAVVTTDMLDPLHSGRFQSVANANQGRQCRLQIDVSTCPGLDGAEVPPAVIRASDPRYQDAFGEPDREKIQHDFGCRATAGSSGDGVEMGLEAARRALSPGLLASDNAGFLRDDALLAVIFLSDENDCSRAGLERPGANDDCEWFPEKLIPVEEYAAFFGELKGGADKVIMAGIIGPDTGVRYTQGQRVLQSCFQEGGVDAGTDEEGAYAGYRYEALIDAFEHSGKASICESPFEAALAAISEVIPEAVVPCLNELPAQCDSEDECGEVACEVRGNIRVCADLRIQVELERDAEVGALEDRRCDHLPGARMRCILLEGEDYVIEYGSGCGDTGVGIDLLIERQARDTLIARYPRLRR